MTSPHTNHSRHAAVHAAKLLFPAAATMALGGCLWNPFAPPMTAATPQPTENVAAVMPTADEVATPLPMDADKVTRDLDAALAKADKAQLAQLIASVDPTSPLAASATMPAARPAGTLASKKTPATQPAPVAEPEQVAMDPPPASTQPATAMASLAIEVPATQAATQPATQPAAAAPAPTLADLLPLLRERVQEHPNALAYALALQLLDSAENATPNAANLSALAATDQTLITDLVAAVQQLSAAPPAPTVTLADRAGPIAAAAETWKTAGDLALPTLALASRVDSYGVYTEMPATFAAGKRHVAIIYCEVENFAATRTAEGKYQTALTQQDTLITSDGLLVWRPTAEEVVDVSRNKRRDFYLVKKLTLPETLAAGKYTLRLTVTDKQSNKIAMATLPIEIK